MKKQKRVASSTAATSILDFSDMPDNFPAVNCSIGVSASAELSGKDAGRSEVPCSGSHIDLRNLPADWFTTRVHFDVVFPVAKQRRKASKFVATKDA